MYERILVPTDGSASADAAMTEAVTIATEHGAAVHVLHVVNTRYYDTSIESAVEPLREDGQRYLDRLVEVAEGVDVPTETAIEVGRPGREILEYVGEHDIDLVVMGTRGRGGLRRRLLGSVAEHVVTHAGVPVYVVPAAD
mgnify:CR=1 FL=1